jgi:Na+/H+ antiporter NhaD/arsenite permease-like protein
MSTYILLIAIITAFVCMAKSYLKQEVAFPLLALFSIILIGPHEGNAILGKGFSEFSRVAVIFSSIAIPAHMLERSGALTWFGKLIGETIGIAGNSLGISPIAIVPFSCIIMTYALAAGFHNVTSILISANIVVVVCRSYKVYPLPVLCASLVASNLGGFSTRWGDTPNIIEAAVWNLGHLDFFLEILPINLGLLFLLSFATSLLIRKRSPALISEFDICYGRVAFRRARQSISIDKRLLYAGLSCLVLATVGPMVSQRNELTFSALSILFCCLLDRSRDRKKTLMSLGMDTYATLCAVFVLAGILSGTTIGLGKQIGVVLGHAPAHSWIIALASYLGTSLTEAASWAAATSPLIHSIMPTHLSAWLLGAGICAGSSSLVTAASAGILLVSETKGNSADARVTFGSYLPFGVCFSLLMLCYYILVLSILHL